ncbi:MAG: hypothetical protein JO325_15390 [Solirubrobacterales bacterium]|nr:hypothetical protein [Solirubrobacterales bacterium]
MKVIENDRYRTAVRDQAVHQLIDRGLDRRTTHAEARERAPPKVLAEPVNCRRQMRP